MARIGARIAQLERNRPEPLAGPGLDLDLSPDMRARIMAAKAAGTCPQSLSDADLRAIVQAHDAARGSHDRP